MAFEYRTELTEKILKSPQARRILSYLSPVYGDAYVMLWLIQITGALLDKQDELGNDHIIQAFPQTATWSISRWEEQCGVTPDPEWDLSQRRRALIAREKPTTPMGPGRLEEIVSNAAGGRVSITENTGKNAFRLTFWEGPETPAMNRRGAFRELNRFKPAHLIYTSELRMEPVVLSNPQAFYLSTLLTRLWARAENSLGHSRLLLGYRASGETGAALSALRLGAHIAQKEELALASLLARSRERNRQGLSLSGAAFRVFLAQEQGLAARELALLARQRQGQGVSVGGSCRARERNLQRLGAQRLSLHTGAANREDAGARLIRSNTEWRFNGRHKFNGTKKFNGGIRRSEL